MGRRRGAHAPSPPGSNPSPPARQMAERGGGVWRCTLASLLPLPAPTAAGRGDGPCRQRATGHGAGQSSPIAAGAAAAAAAAAAVAVARRAPHPTPPHPTPAQRSRGGPTRGGPRGRPGRRRTALLGVGRSPLIAAGATRSDSGRRRRLCALAPQSQLPRPVFTYRRRHSGAARPSSGDGGSGGGSGALASPPPRSAPHGGPRGRAGSAEGGGSRGPAKGRPVPRPGEAIRGERHASMTCRHATAARCAQSLAAFLHQDSKIRSQGVTHGRSTCKSTPGK
jgi:hypothetical protein